MTAEPTTDTSTSESTRKFQQLSTYFLDGLPVELRWPIYNEVLRLITPPQDDLMGMVHRGNFIQIAFSDSPTAKRSKTPEEILLKNTPGLREQLEAIAKAAVIKEIVKNGARGTSVEDLEAINDLDFDAMVAASKSQQQRSMKGGAASAKITKGKPKRKRRS